MDFDLTSQILPFKILFYFLAGSYMCKNMDHDSV